MKINSRLIAIFGVILSIVACAIMADWQSIPHDPCTDYSLFHHPGLVEVYSSQMTDAQKFDSDECVHLQAGLKNVHVYTYLHFDTGVMQFKRTLPQHCQQVISCNVCNDTGETANVSSQMLCLQFTLNPNQLCFHPDTEKTSFQQQYHHTMACNTESGQMSTCFGILDAGEQDNMQAFTENIVDVHIQSLELVNEVVERIARDKCESSNNSGHHCHWIPDSPITKKHCEDCQPICRSVDHTLNFVQFCIGALLFMLSMPIARESMTAIISDVVTKNTQVSLA